MVHYRADKRPPMVHTLNQMNPVHSLQFYFPEINFDIILSPIPMIAKWNLPFRLLLLLLLWLYSPLLGLGRFFSFLILYIVGRTPWTWDQPVARSLPSHRTTQTQNKRTQYRHPCLQWDSNPRSQRSSERSQFMP
jgi:hypothetical protein